MSRSQQLKTTIKLLFLRKQLYLLLVPLLVLSTIYVYLTSRPYQNPVNQVEKPIVVSRSGATVKSKIDISEAEDNKFTYEISSDFAKVKIEKSNVNPNEKDNFIMVDKPTDTEEDKDINTNILFVDDTGLQFESAEVTLARTNDNPINAVLTCPTWDFNKETGTCNKWEIAEVTPTISDDHITFKVNHFSAYAGAYLEILNVQTNLTVGDIWEVRFNTYGTSDLTVEGIEGTVYGTDVEFIEFYCGENKYDSSVYDGNKVFIENYSCENNLTRLVDRSVTPGRHVLQFTYGDSVEIAKNFACNTGTLSDDCYVSSTQAMTNGSTISGTGNLIIQSGGNLTTASLESFSIDMDGSVTILSGGAITGNVESLTASDFDLQSGGNINLLSKGYVVGAGPGASPSGSANNGTGGAGYGGAGGTGESGFAGGVIYGNIATPTDYGSAGGIIPNQITGGYGAGKVKIDVTGTATISGTINATGGNGAALSSSYATGGASGGSIYIIASTIAGSGTMTTNGGNGGNGTNADGGGGGGGRIALYYDTKTFNGTMTAIGGSAPDGGLDGAAGTIYEKPSGQTYANLTINNSTRNAETSSGFVDATNTFDTLNMIGTAYLNIPDGLTVTVTNSFNPTENFRLTNTSSTGILTYPTPLDITTTGTTTLITGGTDKWPLRDITVSSGSLTLNGEYSVRNVAINSGGTLKHSSNASTQTNTLVINASGDFTINSGGTINLVSLGYSVGAGPGAGSNGSLSNGSGGGGYGGAGGAGESGIAGGSTYGSETDPVDLGSAGGIIAGQITGGYGGGLVKIVTEGTTTINGAINASGGNGANLSTSYATGGASGGTVQVITEILAGDQNISAIGGNGGNSANGDGGGGGGGRIVVFSGESTYSGNLLVTGGTGPDGALDGGIGTTYTDYTRPTLTQDIVCDIVGNECTPIGESSTPQQSYLVSSLSGTATESDTAISSIQLAIKDTDTNMWYDPNSAAFDSGTQVLFDVSTVSQTLPYTGAVTWSHDTSAINWSIDHTYEVTTEVSNPKITAPETFEFVFSNSPPIVENATASQASNGHVNITYDVTDAESASTDIYILYDVGTTLSSNIDTSASAFSVSDATRFSNSGTIMIGNEFITYTSKSSNSLTGTITRGAVSTTNVTHTAGDTVWLLAAGVTGDSGSVVNGTSKSIDWTAKTDQDGLDYDTMKVRVVSHDGASSSMIGSDESTAFAIDVKDPALSANFRIDASLATPLIYVPCTDESTIQMKLGTASDLSGSSLQTFASSINFASAGVTFSNGMTLYGQCTDPYSNSTTIQTAVIPGIPSNIFYQDVSNPSLDDWREFLAWGVIDATSIAFDSYKIYRSENGGSYTLHETIVDRQLNYFVDTELDETIEYRYRIRSEDANGNISAYSSVITDTPNGSGGTDLSTPTITGVAVSNVTATQATITWTTNKFASSTVYLEATSSYPGSNKADYDSSQGNPSMVTSHSVILSGLTPNTTYSFLTESIDSGDNIANASDNSYQFTTDEGPQITNVSVISVLDDQAVITWKTDIAATSYVIYSENADLSNPTSTRGSDDLVTTHSITLTSLDIGTNYYFYVRSTDGDSNTTEDKNIMNGAPQYYSVSTTVDTDDPVISSVTVSLTGEKGATITWRTNENATSTVNWGTTTSLGQTTEITDIFTTLHSISLTGLSANTQYYYTVTSVDNSGNSATSSQSNFTTSSVTTVEVEIPITDESLEEQVADTLSSIVEDASESVVRAVLTALSKNDNLAKLSEESLTDFLLNVSEKTISAPTIGGADLTIEPGATTAVVSWVTDRPANSLVAYVPEDQYDGDGSFAVEVGDSSASVTEHTVTIEGLQPETTYLVQSRSKGTFGPAAVSDSNIFTTTTLTADIANIQIEQVNENAATLIWETTIPTRSEILITDTTTGEAQTFENPNFIRDHSFTTEELNPSTNYTAQVISIDEGGGETESTLVPFSTILNTSPPTISDVRVVTSLIPGKVEQVQTIISWNTNKPATSRVVFDEGVRPNGELRLSVPEDTSLRREHIVISSAFTPGKVYSYRVESVDTGGNAGQSQNYTLLTPQPRESVVDLIVKNLEEMFGFLN